MTLAALAEKLRKRLTEYRQTNRFDTKINSAINCIEIALGLTEFALDKSRPIEVYEESWFEESWTIIKPLEDTEWEDIIDLYRTLGFKLKERNWFRP
ncbi:MAG: hypothetical protein KBF42_10305 [Chitinophagales bacterium]|jgi:hypothetical protein|nr:hypothetical protein [Bacteroidota bacterium]MBP9221769.1 hypothetical protein [Chitinophagales bacterium]